MMIRDMVGVCSCEMNGGTADRCVFGRAQPALHRWFLGALVSACPVALRAWPPDETGEVGKKRNCVTADDGRSQQLIIDHISSIIAKNTQQ